MHFIKSDGSDVPDGICVTPDHYQQVFTIVIRSMSPVHPDSLKDLIQTRHEVLDVDLNKEICVVK